MAAALGVRFLKADGRPCSPGGGGLGELKRIDLSGLDQRIADTEILVACDVTNPLTGPDGASATYGPQKGAGPEMVTRLDGNLAHLAEVIREQTGLRISGVPGAGAAGGLGAGLMAFAGARLESGFRLVAEAVDLESGIRGADLVITGEGRMDEQTRFGKTPYGVAELARKFGRPVIGVAGSLEPGAEELYRYGFDLLMPVQERPMELSAAIREAGGMLRRTGERIARSLLLGGRIV